METFAGSDIKPDVACYKYALHAMSESKAHFIEGLGYQAENILTRMEENALMPDSACFSYAIQTWCNSACRNELTQKEIYEEAGKAHEMLDRMEAMHFRSGSVVVHTSTVDYNKVMRAWSRSSSQWAVSKVERLLSNMEKKYKDGDALMRPNHESYLYAIKTLGNSPDVGDQVDGALAIISRMKEQYKNGNHACEPNVECYNAVIAVCGNRNFNSASETEKRKALKCAIDVVQKMRKNKNKEVQPNSRTYNLGLEAFGVLLDKKSAEYQKVIESVFVKCCNEGLVDDKVIKTFHRIAPYELYRRSILVAASPNVEMDGTPISDTLFLPEEWTKNINGSTCTRRQSVPLAVDGRFVHERSRSVSEHKMRRLRTRQNKIMLQGGRM